MAREVFVDTSGFYAALVKGDDRHTQAAAFLQEARRKRLAFVTTDYVLDETATLLKARGMGHLAAPFFQVVQSSSVCSVEWMDPESFAAAQRFFLKHHDQPWSFTDCVSFCVMKARRTREALTKDGHFGAAGFVALLV